eukprot:360471-Chlamydomonas_euryale.AAC.3
MDVNPHLFCPFSCRLRSVDMDGGLDGQAKGHSFYLSSMRWGMSRLTPSTWLAEAELWCNTTHTP